VEVSHCTDAQGDLSLCSEFQPAHTCFKNAKKLKVQQQCMTAESRTV